MARLAVKRRIVPWALGVAWAWLHAVLGCNGTEGPLIVRKSSASAGAAGAAGAGTAGAAGASSVAGGAAGGTLVRPAVDVSWQVQLSGAFDASIDVALYYVDSDELTSAERQALTNAGRHLACYLSAGSYEPWRGDAAAFPAEVLGNTLADYPNERWLDVRSSAVTSLMSARLDRFVAEGCVSVVVSNVTTSSEESGFSVTTTDQNEYLTWLSTEIRSRKMLAGLATADDRLSLIEPYFDWTYAQGCWIENQCSDYAPFVTAGKAVLAVEIGDATTAPTLCQGVAGSGINLLIKPRDLGAGRVACSP